MRYIDNREIKCSSDWIEKSKEALEEVQNGKSISDYSSVWRDLKPSLADLSNDKCWYCESEQERSDDAVDHFRPKSKYWWLAFERSNFRYSCTFCNSRRKNPATGATHGKGDAFPLLDEGKRGVKPNDEIHEQPMLLDPCISADTHCLDFLMNGTPCPRYPKDSTRKQKAEKSIELYHLDHPDSIETRRRIAIEIESWIKEAEKAYQRMNGNDMAADSFAEKTRDIISRMRPDRPYSVFAKRVVMGHRDYEWIEDLIATL